MLFHFTALLSAHVSNVVINWSEMQFHWVRAGIFAVVIIVDIGVAIYQRYFSDIINRTSYVVNDTFSYQTDLLFSHT